MQNCLTFSIKPSKIIQPACSFAMGIEVEANIYLFCFVVTPNKAMCRIAVIIKGKFNDEHRIIVVIMNEEVVILSV